MPTGTVAAMQAANARHGQRYSDLMPLAAAVLVAALAVGWLLLRQTRQDAPLGSNGPVLVSAAELRRFAESRDQPVFWAGPLKDTSYELTATPGGRVFVRYLPPNVTAGDKRSGFLTVGTYPSRHPYADLERAARADDAVGVPLPGGVLVLMSRRAPRSVYLARRGSHYQVEVYDSSLDTARNLVLSGAIRPVR
jgi:hypothetical protein